MNKESTTFRTPEQEKQMSRLFEDAATAAVKLALKKVDLDRLGLQRLLGHGDEVKSAFNDVAIALAKKFETEDTFSKEVTVSNCTYPSHYKGPGPIKQQIEAVAKYFQLDPAKALRFIQNLPELPEGAEGWFAIPSYRALARREDPATYDKKEQYFIAANYVCSARSQQSRKVGFENSFKAKLNADYLELDAKTAYAYDKLMEDQDNSDILVVACQTGMKYRGESVRRAIVTFQPNEFGLDIVAGMSIDIVHPTRFTCFSELDMDLPGNRHYSGIGNRIVDSPFMYFRQSLRLQLDTGRSGCCGEHYGSASGFLPQ
ncbi:MAG: hypothetical protein WCI57_04105 [Candidatus Berkelbacteria bacterium]